MKSESSKPDETIAALVWAHYKRIGLKKGWNRDRFNRLCAMMNLLPEELGALCCVSRSQVENYRFNDRFPPTVSLHLAIIEGVFLELQCGKEWQPIVPLHLLKNKTA